MTHFGRQSPVAGVEAQQIASARQVLPGGALGGTALPEEARLVISHGAGGRFWDTSGNCYIDYALGSGAMLLGHAHPAIHQAVAAQALRGVHFFNYLNETALQLCERLQRIIPCAERIRLTTTGSETTFHAIRLARAFTGRPKLLKFEGGYHGTHDYAQLATAPKQVGNDYAPLPDTAGIPDVVAELMLVAPYNDLDAARRIIEAHKHELAAVIVEPIQRIISPQPGFLEGLREITREAGVLLIFDEVVTGFRHGLAGMQGRTGITPDLGCFAKVIGGGLPLAFVAGRADIMDQADPGQKGSAGYVYQNGTLQGFPLGCAAALATLDVLEQPGFYETLEARAETLKQGMQAVLDRHGMATLVIGDGAMWNFHCADRAPRNYRDILASDTGRQAAIDRGLLAEGIFLIPGTRRFVCSAHTDEDFAATIAALDRVCARLKP